MNPTHLKMARHMLGLPNRTKRSYRNRYFAPPGGSAHKDLQQMEAKGWVVTENEGGRHIFGRLTRVGAEMALERGEALCPEDFPS